jgi:hypothetical protein
MKTNPLVSKLLLSLGGAIVVLGIGILLAQHWADLPSIARVIVSLGAGGVALIAGIVLDRRYPQGSGALYAIAGSILPLGCGIALYEAGIVAGSFLQAGVWAILAAVAWIGIVLAPRPQFLFWTVLYGSLAFFSLVGGLFQWGPADGMQHTFSIYSFIIAGVSITICGLYASSFDGIGSFKQRIHLQSSAFAAVFYCFGALMLFAALLALGGWRPSDVQGIIAEIAFLPIALGALYASVYIKSRLLTVLTVLFSGIYGAKMSAEYFAETLGWPIVLICAGIIVITLGFLSLKATASNQDASDAAVK